VAAAGDLDIDAVSIGTRSVNDVVSVTGITTITTTGDAALLGINNDFMDEVSITAGGDLTLFDQNDVAVNLIQASDVTITAGSLSDFAADGGTPATPGEADIVVTGVLDITTTGAVGAPAEALEIVTPSNSVVVIDAGSVYADFLNEVTFGDNVTIPGLQVLNAGVVELTADRITVAGNFNTGNTAADLTFTARDIIVGGGGTITAFTLQLDALNQVNPDAKPGDSVIGGLAAPIFLDMSNGANYQVPNTTLNGFGFISASNFTGSDFTRIFNDSGNKIFLIANFTDLIASVQGSFITAQIFTIDSSQFRADLNIFGVDGAGLLLPLDQCEDEESADCAKQ
jgi:hypothetical protein